MDIANYAWIEGGVVTNCIVWDGNTDPATGGFLPPEDVTIILIPEGSSAWMGWGWDGTEFTPPVEA